MTKGEFQSRRPRFHLRSLLVLVALCGILAGWWADRTRLTEQLRKSEVENQIRQKQLETLQQQLSVQYGAVQIQYWWADADAFVKMLTTTSDDEKFLEMAPSLAQADSTVIGNSIKKLTTLLRAPDERTRSRALISLRFLQEMAPDRISDHASSIVRKLIPLLKDQPTGIRGEAICAIQSFGPDAKDAVDPLRQLMEDDSDWYAPDSAVAIARIDPTVDIGPRLSALIVMKHPNWYQAAFHLPQHVDPKTARRVLTKVYDESSDVGERNAVIQAMNQIPKETQP